MEKKFVFQGVGMLFSGRRAMLTVARLTMARLTMATLTASCFFSGRRAIVL